MSEAPAWKRRFTAPTIRFPHWASGAPERLAYVSNEHGSLQAWSHDLDTGERRRLSDEHVGVEEALVTPDGSRVAWWQDATGNEHGRWVAAPFEGGEPAPFVAGVPDAWNMGMDAVGEVTAVGLSLDDGTYAVHIETGGRPARELYRHERPAGVAIEWESGRGGLSADASLVCVRHAERGDIEHYALRALETWSGATAGEQWDQGLNLLPGAWSPVAGDQRLVIRHEREGYERPAIWDLAGGKRRDLAVDLPGAVEPLGWWPDASAILVLHDHEGRHRLYRLDPMSGALELVVDPEGTVSGAAVRPDGSVWYRGESGAHAARILSTAGGEVVTADGERAPEGHRYRSLRFENSKGESIHGFLATPPGEGPHPVVLSVHGGPNWHWRDAFDPMTQAFVDHGFAVAMVNYRGSTGYGTEFREALKGNIGFPETEDTLAALDSLVAEGVADPTRVFIEGFSWGGYITLLALGLHPNRFRGGIAGIPVGDYVAAHYECSPPLREWDLATLGGSPAELPELYHERNPMTYVDRVRAPVLVIAGMNDSRCPIGQVMAWVTARRGHGGRVDLHLYDSGHHAMAIDEQVLEAELELGFLLEHTA